jgi:hypothetical protein
MDITISNYEAWITYVFDHPEAAWGDEWFWRDDQRYWSATENAQQAVEYMTQLYSHPAFLIGRFSTWQIGTGIDFLINPSLDDHSFTLIDTRAPLRDRLDCIRSITTLYRDLFARVCARRCLHGVLDDKEPNQANNVCFMFWDTFPMFARTKHREACKEPNVRDHWEDHVHIEDACLTVMEETLKIDHPACQEGALHGLGEWVHAYPERVTRVIEGFLATHPNEQLSRYAGHALVGYV